MATRKSSKKSTRKTGSRRYGAKAGKKVQRAMQEMKGGKLRSGRSKKKVTSRKQAIAIGLSEARSAGAKVPRPRKSSKSSGGSRGSTSRKSGGRSSSKSA
jgi:hypothetical protein